jgi:5'-nucleotidase
VRFLLTNDDGIDAPGIAALAAAIEGRKLVVAPHREQSGCSHSVTTHSAITIEAAGERRWAVEGAPADCVRVALHRFGDEFDYILAGINSGGNLGADIYHSGTVAAVREGVLHGIPGIAVSRYRSRSLDAADWRTAGDWLRPLLAELIARPAEAATFWNINLPCLPPGSAAPEVVFCPLDLRPLPLKFTSEDGGLRYAGVYSERERAAGSDVDVCFSGKIAVTRIELGG